MWLGNSFEVPFCLKKLKATIIGKLNFQKKLTVLKKYQEIYQNMSKSPLRGPGTSFQISFFAKNGDRNFLYRLMTPLKLRF